MKKLLYAIVFASLSLVLFAQAPNDIENLQKQINVLKSTNLKLEGRLKQITKNAASVRDSLQTRLVENDGKLKGLSDSLAAKISQINTLKAESDKAKTDIHSIAASNTIQYIFFLVALILILTVYFLLAKKVQKAEEENKDRMMKTKEELELKLNKTGNDIKSDLTEAREDLQGKINDLGKKLAAIKAKE